MCARRLSNNELKGASPAQVPAVAIDHLREDTRLSYELSQDTVKGLISTMRQWIKSAMESVAEESRTSQERMTELPELLPLLEELEAKVGEGEGLERSYQEG